MSNKTIEEIDKIIATYLEGLHNPKEDGLYNELRAKRDTEALKQAVNQLILQERIKELEALHDDLSLEAREAGACDLIHQKTNKLIDQLKEKSKP